MVAEAIEATPEVVRSASKAREAAEGEVEAAGEAGQECPQYVNIYTLSCLGLVYFLYLSIVQKVLCSHMCLEPSCCP